MNFSCLHQQNTKFNFLSQDEMNSLIKEYYEGRVAMTVLKAKYNLPINSHFESNFPWKKSEVVCDLCSTQMIVVPHHRDRNPNDPQCPNCSHINKENCRCKTCCEVEYQAYLEDRKKRDELILNQLILEESQKIDFNKLTSEEKISLGILVRDMSSDYLTHIVPFRTKENWKYNKSFVLPLVKAKILTVHPESDYDHISVKKNKFKETILTVEFHKMKWNINVYKDNLSNLELYNYLANTDDELKLTRDEIFLYWKKIAKDEALKYFAYNFNTVLNIEFERDFAIENLLEYLTNHFSIGQIYNLIWKYTNNTLRFKTEQRVTKDHVSNYLLKCIKNEAEKIIQNHYKLEHFGKPKYIQDSSFSDFFFDYILRANEQGYRITPLEIFERYKSESDETQDLGEFKTVGDYLNTFKFLSVNKESFEDNGEDDLPW
ncbi:hypothetical protein E0I26_01950 [Flavobacterium rhamnosiphilum]|uniref:Uncharacterized protein n=1 Tax=Flavobacterium rhamnosiphilum TaxID=2541724 RepID=A0A4R5FCJ6_9FLAO|nr:hypothetical protein [Flavobacterium rhamnosiphilum]TDE46873.1 hypothetical protein E0I26_01950 [Flavobacterium rhamnosiphilum]